MSLKIALILSVILQFSTAIIALSLIRRTRTNIAWWLISAGFFLMAIRRLFELLEIFDAGQKITSSLLNSWIGVMISVVMLISLSFIKRIFNIQKRFDELKKEMKLVFFRPSSERNKSRGNNFLKNFMMVWALCSHLLK